MLKARNHLHTHTHTLMPTHGAWFLAGVLRARAVPDAVSSVMGEAWVLEEMPHSWELAPCGPVLLLPTFADPHTAAVGSSMRGASAGRRLPSAHAGEHGACKAAGACWLQSSRAGGQHARMCAWTRVKLHVHTAAACMCICAPEWLALR